MQSVPNRGGVLKSDHLSSEAKPRMMPTVRYSGREHDKTMDN
jgi:hypothetical protein